MAFLEENLEIILITYNRKNKLENTLSKCFSETSPVRNIDFTILDNSSNDGTSDLCKNLKSKYQNIKYIKNPKNIGGDANYCKALELASKKYIWVLCDDDELIWDKWDIIENALKTEKYDAIFVRKCEYNIGNIFKEATFIPAAIYKTNNINDTTIFNAYDNIRNKLPQLALIAEIVNKKGKIFIPDFDIIKTAPNGIIESYSRGLNKTNIPYSKTKYLWSVGYINSIELINDKETQHEIIQNITHRIKHLYKDLFTFFLYTLKLNFLACNNYQYNKYQIKRMLSFRQKLTFEKANFLFNIRKLFIDKSLYKLNSTEIDWNKYLEKVKNQKHINKLSKKYKNKKIILYGAGKIFEIINSKYDLSQLNIVAICDGKFKNTQIFSGIKAIPRSEIIKQKADIILFSLYRQDEIKDSLITDGINLKCDSLIKNTLKTYKNI